MEEKVLAKNQQIIENVIHINYNIFHHLQLIIEIGNTKAMDLFKKNLKVEAIVLNDEYVKKHRGMQCCINRSPCINP